MQSIPSTINHQLPAVTAGRSRDHGFTLLEMAIVLVVIGLISGSIFIGRDMIKAAQRRSQLEQFQEFLTAFDLFKEKYLCLPGDCSNASQSGLGSNGDGDGVISNQGIGIVELMYAWQHLGNAGLITGKYDGNYDSGGTCYSTSCPVSTVNNSGAVWIGGFRTLVSATGLSTAYGSPYAASDANNALMIVSSSFRWYGALDVNDAMYLDTKIDDGVADTGKILSFNSNCSATGCVTGTCGVTNGSVNYNPSDSANDCLVAYVFETIK
jgi:prepilin-type N-terminal cleavage/methylation domain-containing protein